MRTGSGRGSLRVDLPPGALLPAPLTGLHLGTGQAGPVSLRLFRRTGTRVVLAGHESPLLPAALVALRAASCGAAVRVHTTRPELWSAAVAHGVDSLVVDPRQSAPGAARPAGAGPALFVDDRTADPRGLGELGAWQCRLDVRTPTTGQELVQLGHADLAIVGALPATVALSAASYFGVPAATAVQLSALPRGSVAVLRRGAVDYVSLDPTPAEAALLPV